MSHGSRPPKRPSGGSRNPVGRPRKVAGRREHPAPADETPGASEPPGSEGPRDEPPVGPPPPPEEPEPDPEPEPEPEPAPERSAARAGEGFLAGRRSTVALLVALVVLVGLLAVESWYLWGDEESPPSASRPVVTGEIAHRAAVEAAAQDVTDILSYGYQDFDAQVDDATSKMTPEFASKYRQTAAGVRKQFVEQKLTQEFKVVGQSVVLASDEKVQALLFLDQYVTHGRKGTSVTPYRALVTMQHTDSGWLVENIETQ